MSPQELLQYIVQVTARGMVYGRVFMASRDNYTIVGGRERGSFSIMLLRDSLAVYHQELPHPGLAAIKMIEVWAVLKAKLAGPAERGAYRRFSIEGDTLKRRRTVVRGEESDEGPDTDLSS